MSQTALSTSSTNQNQRQNNRPSYPQRDSNERGQQPRRADQANRSSQNERQDNNNSSNNRRPAYNKGGQSDGLVKIGRDVRPDFQPDIIRVSGRREAKFYIFLVKEVLNKGTFEVVQLHGAGDMCISTIIKVVSLLTRLKYVTVSRIKTGSIQGRDGTKVVKLIVHLTKAPEFEAQYVLFEQVRSERRVAWEQKELVKKAAEAAASDLQPIQEGEAAEEESKLKEHPAEEISQKQEKSANSSINQKLVEDDQE